MARFSSFHILFFMFITGNNNNKYILFLFFHLCLYFLFDDLVCVLKICRRSCCFRHRLHTEKQLSLHRLAGNFRRKGKHPRRRRVSIGSRRFRAAHAYKRTRMVRPVLGSYRLQLRLLGPRQLRHRSLRQLPKMHRHRSNSLHSG